MALNTDLDALVTKIRTFDASLLLAEASVVKYPRIFSSDARTEITSARSMLQNIIQELVDGSALIVQLAAASKV